MSNSIFAREPIFRFPQWRTAEHNTIDQKQYDALASELQASLSREEALRDEKRKLSQRQGILAQELEHRVANGLQLIASSLVLQSRAMTTAEASVQLGVAARRIHALGSVHHRLLLLNQPAKVEFRQYLIALCDDLAGLLFQSRTDHAIVVEGTKVEIPSSLANPLGLIATELITNSVKHANGNITVRIEKTALDAYSMSVLDDGPGPPLDLRLPKAKGWG